MSKTVEIKFGGETRSFELLPREKVEEIIDDLEFANIARKAYEAYVPGYRNGIVALDLITGEIVTFTLGNNEQLHPFDNVEITLYGLVNDFTYEDIWAETGNIFSEEEYAEYEEMLEDGEVDNLEEYAEKKGIDLDERFIEFLADVDEQEKFYADIKRQLNDWYKED